MSRLTFLLFGGLLPAAAILVVQAQALAEPPGPHTRPALKRAENPDPEARPEPPPLDKEQEEELLAVLKEKLPTQYERLIKLREERPRVYNWAVRGTWRWYQRWKDLPEEVQQAAIEEQAAEVQIVRTLEAMQEAKDPAEKQRLKERLEDAVARHFQAEQKKLEYRLEELKKAIRRLEEELQRRSEDRAKIIQQRLERYLTGGPAARQHPPLTTAPAEKKPAE